MSNCFDAITAHSLPILDFSCQDVLIDYMLFNHGIMRASERLLETAINRAGFGPVRKYYVKHLGEETNHAAWIAADLATIGVKPPQVHWRAARLAGTQYYLIHHVSPMALLGYMAALESRPMALSDVEKLEQVYSIDLIRTIRYHAEHDIEHGADLLALIATLDSKTQDLITDNARHTARLLSREDY